MSLASIVELALKVTNTDEAYGSVAEAEQALWEKYECSFETFEDIVRDLIPYAHISQSPLTKEVYRGFANHELSEWIIKEPVTKEN